MKKREPINLQKYLDEMDNEEDGIMTDEEIKRAVKNSAPLIEKALAQFSQKKKD